MPHNILHALFNRRVSTTSKPNSLYFYEIYPQEKIIIIVRCFFSLYFLSGLRVSSLSQSDFVQKYIKKVLLKISYKLTCNFL